MTRTSYSFKTAIGSVDEAMSRLKEAGHRCAPIADRLSTFGFPKWRKAAAAASLLPVFGVEIAVVPELGSKKPIPDFWRFYAIDSLRPLHDLILKATRNPGKEPSLVYEQALAAPGVIKVTGERTLLARIADPKIENLYLGLYPSTPLGLSKEAQTRGFRFLASSDNYYPREADLEFYRVALGRRASTQTYPMHILSDREWHEAAEHLADKQSREKAIENRNIVFDRCRAKLIQSKPLVPEKPVSLRELCEKGAIDLGISLGDPIYKSRLDRELSIIAAKHFEDYFFIVADMVRWAKQRMIVGAGRGSSAGSLVCFLLGITAVNPIPFGLLFERFIDLTRSDLPDIDIDLSDTRRHLVFEYAEQKYGKDRVARLGTVGMFQPRSALVQAGTSLYIPRWKTEKIYDSIIDRSPGDERASMCLLDTLTDTDAGRALAAEHPEIVIAARMEGMPHNAGQHAAGIVITDEPVVNYVAVDARTGATMCDKKDAEDLGLLKIDALGLTQLSVFERALELMGVQDNPNGWLSQLLLDDPRAYDVLNKGLFSGLFQFSGAALRSLTKQVKVTCFDDLVSLTALARPGPMANAKSWVMRKNRQEEVSFAHESLKPILEKTLGIIIFQEQVMQIAKEVGDLSWEDVTALRRAMGKSLGKETLDKYGEAWKTGAIAKGFSVPVADAVWMDLCAHGEYSFNLSHAVVYSLNSYYTMWLKAHHPLEFAAASLDAEALPEKQIAILRELRVEGINYVAVDVERSTDKWTIRKNQDGSATLIGPLTAIKGIGPSTVREVMDARMTGQPVRDTLAKRLELGKTEIDSLTPIADAVAKFDLIGMGIESAGTPVIDVQCGIDGTVVIFALAKKISIKDENDAAAVARRGREYAPPYTKAVNMFFADDTDELFCKINRFSFDTMGRSVLDRAKVGKSLYALKGVCPRGFRMLDVKDIRYLGEME